MRGKFKYTVIFTENCNLRCKYCYVDKTSRSILYEVIDALLLLVEADLKSGANVSVDIFGGEPLIEWEKVKYLIEKSKKFIHYNFRITIFTNGILLSEEILRYLKLFNYVNLNFSLDGCKECHDSCRVYPDGSGSYNDVVKGIKLFNIIYGRAEEELFGKFMVSPMNLDYVMDTAKYNASFQRPPRASFSPIRDNSWTKEDIIKYKNVVNSLAKFYVENINKGLWYDIFAIPLLDYEYSSIAFCSAGKNQVGVSPEGDLYPCQRFYNNRSPYKIGTVFTGIDYKSPNTILFKKYLCKQFIGCSTCDTFTKTNCMGQCIAAMYETSGNIFKCIPTVCEILKYNYELARWVENKLYNNPIYRSTFNKNAYGG